MSSVNKAIIIGHLGQDPDVRYTQSGAAVANFSLATNEYWNDKEGNRQERTEWHRIVVWGRTAETCKQYLSKGRQVYVEGRLQTRQWQDKDGNTKYTTEIVADQVTFLSGGDRGDRGQGGGQGGGGQGGGGQGGGGQGGGGWSGGGGQGGGGQGGGWSGGGGQGGGQGGGGWSGGGRGGGAQGGGGQGGGGRPSQGAPQSAPQGGPQGGDEGPPSDGGGFSDDDIPF